MKAELDSELFKAIKSINKENLNNEDKSELLSIFNFTQNAAIRDQIALVFAEIKYHEAVPFIIKKINDKTVFNHTGTLVYSLYNLDSIDYFIDLIKIICEQTYESKVTAYSIVNKQIPLIDIGVSSQALTLLYNYKKKNNKSDTAPHDTLEIIDDTINLLKTLTNVNL